MEREKKLRHVAMVAKPLDLNKPCSRKYDRKKRNKLTRMTFSCTVALWNKTVASSFFPSFDNANGRICQERSLRTTNFATMVTWHHTSSLHWTMRQQTIIHSPLSGIQRTCAYCKLFTNGRNQFKFDYHFFTMLLGISPYCSKTALNKLILRNILHKF